MWLAIVLGILGGVVAELPWILLLIAAGGGSFNPVVEALEQPASWLYEHRPGIVVVWLSGFSTLVVASALWAGIVPLHLDEVPGFGAVLGWTMLVVVAVCEAACLVMVLGWESETPGVSISDSATGKVLASSKPWQNSIREALAYSDYAFPHSVRAMTSFAGLAMFHWLAASQAPFVAPMVLAALAACLVMVAGWHLHYWLPPVRADVAAQLAMAKELSAQLKAAMASKPPEEGADSPEEDDPGPSR